MFGDSVFARRCAELRGLAVKILQTVERTVKNQEPRARVELSHASQPLSFE
jgi:hypothetical protein